MRNFVCIAIVTTSSLADAQLFDPRPQTPPAANDSAPASQPSPPSQPSSSAQPSPSSKPSPAPSPVTLKMRRPGDWIARPAPIMKPRLVRQSALPPVVSQADEPPPRRYPFELAARPLVLPPGVTELGVSYIRLSAMVTRPDSFGQVTTTRTSNTPDVNLSHAFSRVELGIGIGQLGYGWIAIDTQSVPRRVELSAAFSAPQPDNTYAHLQSVGLSHKVFGDENAALIGGVGVQVREVNGYDDTGARVEGELLGATAGFIFQAQVVPRFALSFGGAARIPLVQSAEIEAHTMMSGSARLLIAFDTWDIVAGGAIVNPTERFATSLSLGIRKRWGL